MRQASVQNNPIEQIDQGHQPSLERFQLGFVTAATGTGRRRGFGQQFHVIAALVRGSGSGGRSGGELDDDPEEGGANPPEPAGRNEGFDGTVGFDELRGR